MTGSATLLALCVGQPQPLAGGKKSAIDKRPIEGSVHIGTMGLAGDTQVDKRYHGGEHMAVHHYAADHYPYWREQLPGVDPLTNPGAFGENLHASGLTEPDVYIGDRYRLGSALLEVSMGRQPCNTLQRHFARDDMVRRIIANHRCGWYYRVLEEGAAQAGDTFSLVGRPQERWSVDRAFALLFDPKFKRTPGDAQDLLALPALGPKWQAKCTAKRR
ncbi:MOSC domain-containing protein [Qipengyuania marisflavi]|uniref:MOSC domain-containing protein n=1 Tax=Qipengyuania marisflavi TaxID=2486356 RepID=A0A5S3PF14_9SPHN|nr:MOSC domain-containing protein [Qipengyuania marisflavi]TMM50180.1 MOSC domain-containing protein [Qipengyuania marisflavi]